MSYLYTVHLFKIYFTLRIFGKPVHMCTLCLSGLMEDQAVC